MTNWNQPLRVRVLVPGPPVPKGRPRRARNGHWYTPKRTKDYERHVRACARVTLMRVRLFGRWPLDATYELEAHVYPPNRRRMDGDNVLKALCDALNGELWNDDSQVRRKTVEMHPPDSNNPHVELVATVLDESKEAT